MLEKGTKWEKVGESGWKWKLFLYVCSQEEAYK